MFFRDGCIRLSSRIDRFVSHPFGPYLGLSESPSQLVSIAVPRCIVEPTPAKGGHHVHTCMSRPPRRVWYLGVDLLAAVSAPANHSLSRGGQASPRPKSRPPEALHPQHRVPRSILAPPSFRVPPSQEAESSLVLSAPSTLATHPCEMSKRASLRCAGTSQFPMGTRAWRITNASRQMQQGMWGAPTVSFSGASFDCPSFPWFIEGLTQGEQPEWTRQVLLRYIPRTTRRGTFRCRPGAAQVDLLAGRSARLKHEVLCIGEHAILCWSSA